VAGPLIDLLARLWLTQGFFASGALKLINWQATVFLYTVEHPVPGLAPATAAMLGTAIELICPALLLLGLATRAAVIPLIATTPFLHLSYVAVPGDFTLLAWLGLLLVRGAGRLSLDHLLARAVASSAVPLAAAASRIGGLLRDQGTPWYSPDCASGLPTDLLQQRSQLPPSSAASVPSPRRRSPSASARGSPPSRS
jgi:NADH dehydrogenase/putative oxidoreductase